ncbi:protein-disulfide reductase DsbD domain-containing protein [Roseovarius sp. C7]|uniref:protein-disulfide reductase DsbD domain-containing protein n=1 Tax=Roseovarius sp. C7 TaxID=3398643 RepID=UPI0039F6D702
MIKRVLLLALALLASPLHAQSGAQPGEVITARILPGWRLADGTHMAGLELSLAPGWKTYWRAPGDAGIPPQFDWRGSANLAGVEVLWPRPRIIDQAGLKSIGYKEKVTLPLHVKPRKSGGDVTLRGVVDLGVCEDICIPAMVEVSGRLDRGVSRPDPRVAAALASQPLTAREAGVTHVSCQITPAKDGMSITARLSLPPPAALKPW